MSTKEKLIERFKKQPKDFTWDELVRLFGYLHYKGYNGSVEYSEEDKCLHGKILGLKNNLILYEGNSIDELKKDFETGVESYLDRCKRLGYIPEKPYSGEISIHLSSEIHLKIASYAEDHGISIDAFVRDLIEKRLESIIAT